jgi:UDP-2,3-diacylglucosamine hydrolase
MPKNTYFVSDFHLGVAGKTSSKEREQMIVNWMDEVAEDAEAIYFLGDMFDYWFEYGAVIPKGFHLFLGKLSELRNRNIPIYFFTGNHDMWMFRYFQKEMGIPLFKKPITKEILGKKFYLGHGDGLGPADYGYKFIKAIFANPICQFLFGIIHPDIGIPLMRYFSKKSRDSQKKTTFLGKEKEWLILFAEDYLKKHDIDYFVFGHRHLPIDYTLSNGSSRYINLGDWLQYFSYAIFNGKDLILKFYQHNDQTIYTNDHDPEFDKSAVIM